MPEIQNPSPGPGRISPLKTITNLTAAQLRALHTTPVTLIPAPGAGKIISLIGIAEVFSFGTVAYNGTAGVSLAPNYSGDATELISVPLLDPSQIFASFFMYQSGSIGAAGAAILPGDNNTAVVLNGRDNSGGAIATSTLGAPGTGYVANDTGTITTGNGDATYKVLTIGAAGAVATYSITAPGTGYTTGNGQATAVGGAQPGVGTGFTVNVNTITLPDGTMKIVTYYDIIPVP